MKQVQNLLGPYSFIVYYLLTFFYQSVSIILGLAGFDIRVFGNTKVQLKIISFFFLFFIIVLIFLPSFFIYFLTPLFLCTLGFLYVDRKSKLLLDENFVYYTDQRWSTFVNAGKTWFRFGILAAFAGVAIAIIQVQILQGGNGGLFAQYTKCVEYSADTHTCLLQTNVTQLVGDRLSVIMGILTHLFFFWGGLFFVVKNNGLEILKNLTGSEGNFMASIKLKVDKFRKDHYI